MASYSLRLFISNFSGFVAILFSLSAYAQRHNLLLGRPTDQSVTVSVLFDQPADFFLEYGPASGVYPFSTPVRTAVVGTPDEIELNGLQPNSRNYYRMHFRQPGQSAYNITQEYGFHTQRSSGQTFTFTIEADEHLYDKKGVESLYRVCLDNQRQDQPDFMLSLGDIFGDDHKPDSVTSGELDTLHRFYRPFLDTLCRTTPFYVCLGNHEGENDFYLAQNPPYNLAVWATQWRKHYYPNPYPNGFYTGNTNQEGFGIGYPENYYAWTWGDALFLVLDVYRDQCDTSPKPGSWNWSLGQQQYDWLVSTLDTSQSTYKFVFAHHVRGQGRGGVDEARRFEWGGYNQSLTSFDFPNRRPGWLAPIHQLFVMYGVDIFFQGHDHVFAHEVMDGVTYQTLPMAADSTYEIGMLANAGAFESDTLPGSGHLRVTVQPSCTQVDFVRAYLPADTLNGLNQNREVAFSYSIGNCTTSIQETNIDQPLTVFPNPSDAFISILDNGKASDAQVRILDAAGALVKSGNGPVISTQNLASGFYTAVLIQKDNTITLKKIIVFHP